MFSQMLCSTVPGAAIALLAAASAAPAALAAPPAGDPPLPKQAQVAEFDLRFTAEQTTTWDTHDLLDDPCSGLRFTSTAGGRQTLTVRTTGPIPVVVARIRGIGGPIVTHMWPKGTRRDVLAPFRVAAAVDRASEGTVSGPTEGDVTCAEAAPGATQPDSDCGTRQLKGRLQLVPGIQRTGRGLGVEVEGPYMAGGFEDLVAEAYSYCALEGPAGLLPTGMGVISARKLFGKNPRLVAKDERRAVTSSGGTRSVTTTSWRMVLTRRGAGR